MHRDSQDNHGGDADHQHHQLHHYEKHKQERCNVLEMENPFLTVRNHYAMLSPNFHIIWSLPHLQHCQVNRGHYGYTPSPSHTRTCTNSFCHPWSSTVAVIWCWLFYISNTAFYNFNINICIVKVSSLCRQNVWKPFDWQLSVLGIR